MNIKNEHPNFLNISVKNDFSAVYVHLYMNILHNYAMTKLCGFWKLTKDFFLNYASRKNIYIHIIRTFS